MVELSAWPIRWRVATATLAFVSLHSLPAVQAQSCTADFECMAVPPVGSLLGGVAGCGCIASYDCTSAISNAMTGMISLAESDMKCTTGTQIAVTKCEAQCTTQCEAHCSDWDRTAACDTSSLSTMLQAADPHYDSDSCPKTILDEGEECHVFCRAGYAMHTLLPRDLIVHHEEAGAMPGGWSNPDVTDGGAAGMVHGPWGQSNKEATIEIDVPAGKRGECGLGWRCHSHAPLYISLVAFHTKHIRGHEKDLTARG
jgi:hypothetical protein